MAEELAERQQAETTSTAPPEPGRAVAERPKAQLVAQSEGVLPILPRNIEEAQRYASGLIRANIIPDAFRYSAKDAQELGDPSLNGKPNGDLILMGVLQAMELGVGPQSGLKWLLPLRGRFTIWGDLATALAQQKGLVANQTVAWLGGGFDEDTPLGQWPDDFGCEVRIWRKGQDQPYIGKFTVKDAKRASLWMNQRKQPWIDYPKRMLFNRARAFALRDGFADALNGLEIAEEVRDHINEVEEKPTAPSMAALEADTTEPQPENGAAGEGEE